MCLHLFAVVNALDNAATLDAHLSHLRSCDDIVLLESGAADTTLEIARSHGALVATRPFAGYGTQKQSLSESAEREWILRLDADEPPTDDSQDPIRRERAAPSAEGYRLPCTGVLVWRWPHPAIRPNWQLRLARKARGRIEAVPVRATPVGDGAVIDLDVPFRHGDGPRLADRVAQGRGPRA